MPPGSRIRTEFARVTTTTDFQSSCTTTATRATLRNRDSHRSIETMDDDRAECESSMIEMEAGLSLYQDTNKTRPQTEVVDLAVGGMTCSMCSNAVQRALIDVDGVQSVSVSLATNLARIEYENSDSCNPELLREFVEDIGYDVTDIIYPSNNKKEEKRKQKQTKVVEIAVGGMTCSMCTSAVHQATIAMPGVIECTVTLSTNTARVEYVESEECTAEILAENIDDIGYDSEIIQVTSPTGNRCSSSFSDTDEDQDEDYYPSTNEPEDRLQRILKQQASQLNSRRKSFLWCLVGTIPIISITMILPKVFGLDCDLMVYLKGETIVLGRSFIRESLILWVLATFVQFGSGYALYKTAYHGISRGVYGMDVLVTLGMTASYLYAAMATLESEPGYRFFETSAVLLCFVLLGKWMNAMAVCRTSDALTSLMKLQAKTALKIFPEAGNQPWNPLKHSYAEKTVPTESIKPGDIVKILKGASVPADGKVLYGELCVDESMITGESVPVLKMPGDSVLGGTICTETGSGSESKISAAAFVQVTNTGSSTALAQIVQLVQDAQSRQVPIQNLADTIASIFVPAVVIFSFVTFLIWYGCCKGGLVPSSWYPNENPSTFSLLFGIACLVISCPCALGLATPTAVMVGTGVGARHGVLMKGGETLEVAGKVDAIIFDKTGTLTKGRPVVTDLTVIEDTHELAEVSKSLQLSPENALMFLLGSLERNSEHPLATAIVSHAEEQLGSILESQTFVQPSGFVALTGRGASGTINGNITVSVGNRAFAQHQKLVVTPAIENLLQSLESEGKTAILAGINGSVCSVLGVADELKEEAGPSIRYLGEMGVDVWMVTGDSKRTADAIARRLHLPPERVISEALPKQKVEQVRRLQLKGLRVAMVGDGVNDSPALAEADVGMSIGTGAEIATEASDIVLVSGKVSDVCTALDLSRVIFRRIQWNLLFSMIYNLLSIPIAAGLFFPIFHTRLPPTVAALAMALSSVSVVCNSLAIRWYKPPDVMAAKGARRGPAQVIRKILRLRNIPSEQYSLVDQSEGSSTLPVAEIV